MGDTKFDFSGQVAVITGAAVGIGKGAAEAFAGAGAKSYLLDIDDERAGAAAEGIRAGGGEADFIHCDITDSASVKETFERIFSEAGRLDILVNNAGGFSQQLTTAETTEEEWDQVIDRNLKGLFLCSRATIPAFISQKSGRIINMGSGAGIATQVASSPPYAAAKAGVHAMTRVMAFELGGDGITVNAIAPGTTATERVVKLRSEEQRKQIGAMSPLGRIGEVEDMIGWILFLASPEASYFTGQTVAVNGGRLAV
jgi:NAD(P)-dependent dehydrogenase (short-subunit alcohol dehydrogenase family)